MIPRIQSAGGSFRGAGKYYLHDKLSEAAREAGPADIKDQTDERVWFTDTRNCLNTDPQRALDEMWRTAEDQQWLKAQAGVKRSGRVCEDPVKTLSLAWHKDDKPTPEHMIEAADAFLKHMGWDQHQAVYVAHRDTEHKHIHIIVNRVHPETGRTMDDYRERVRAQEWALAYEKEHGKIWCEQREVNAAERAGRAVEPERSGNEVKTPQAANDHLPHNVVMLTREHEQAFKAAEQTREQLDRPDREQLKLEQRAEREAFFANGAKLFKATRHAAYDEVRKEYAPEWRQFYNDKDAAEQSAEAWSANAITRALYFAGRGEWSQAREAFSDRDSVRDAVAAELAERKADLKESQTGDLRERQRYACDALREVRDVQYQDLLQRQRDERAALKAGETLEAIGAGRVRQDDGKTTPQLEPAANENRAIEVMPVQQQKYEPGIEVSRVELKPETRERNEPVVAITPVIEQTVGGEEGGHVDLSTVRLPDHETTAPAQGITDLAASGIGAVASYLADQLGELFAPTPPEVREAQAKAAAKAEAEKPAPEEKPNPYAHQIEAAMRVVEAEREQQKSNEFWKERDRGKGWERDQ